MKKVKSFLLSWVGAIVMTLSLFAIRQTALTITRNSSENDVKIEQEVKRQGYETWPGYAKITASYQKAMSDADEKSDLHNSLKVLSIIICFAPFLWVAVFNGTDSKNNAIWGTLLGIYFGVVGLPYIIPLALRSSVAYEKKICLKDYVEGKNYDFLFPEYDEINISIDQFNESCR